MTEPDPSFLAQRLAWVFRRWGDSGEIVRTFEELSSSRRDLLRARIEVNATEVPVLVAFVDLDEWTVLTTDRLVSCRAGAISSISNAEIRDATIGMSDYRAAGGKAQVASLTVVTADGQAHRLHLEPGPPTLGFLNVLKTIAAANQSRDSR